MLGRAGLPILTHLCCKAKSSEDAALTGNRSARDDDGGSIEEGHRGPSLSCPLKDLRSLSLSHGLTKSNEFGSYSQVLHNKLYQSLVVVVGLSLVG